MKVDPVFFADRGSGPSVLGRGAPVLFARRRDGIHSVRTNNAAQYEEV